MDPIRPIGPRTDTPPVERAPLLGPVEREARRQEREERRRKRARQGAQPPRDDAPPHREWSA